MQSTDKSAQIEKLRKDISKQSIISLSLRTALFIGVAFGLKGIWLDGLSARIAINEGLSWALMAILTVPAMINYFGRAKIAELKRGEFEWKDYYQPMYPLLIVILCIVIAVPLKVAISSCR